MPRELMERAASPSKVSDEALLAILLKTGAQGLDVLEGDFREAVRWGASAVIVAHNHPSGNLEPSDEDLELTRQMIAVSDVVSIPLLDHLILGATEDGSSSYFSVRETDPSIFSCGRNSGFPEHAD